MRLPINQEPETLIEYRESIEEISCHLEELILALEEHADELAPLYELRDIFQELWVSSTKLDLLPISENILILVNAFDFMIEHKSYPALFSEFLLLLVDRLLLIARDVEYSSEIDMLKAQNIHIALQDIILSQSIVELTDKIPSAIAHITHKESEEGGSLSEDFSIDLFDDDTPTTDIEAVDIFVPEVKDNPLHACRDFIKSHQDHAISFLGHLADTQTRHGEEHTEALQEICLTMNKIAGAPIDPEILWAGVTLHDIGLANISEIVSLPRKLTEDEIAQVQQHPLIGAQIANNLIDGEQFKAIILEHHERLDGRGYPNGLSGDQISDGGKILAIVDSFHGMTLARPHKRYSKNLLRAVSEINAAAGTLYDAYWVEIFNDCLKEFWIPDHLSSKTK